MTSLAGQRKPQIDSLHLFSFFSVRLVAKGRGSESTRGSIKSLHSVLTIIHHKVLIKGTQVAYNVISSETKYGLERTGDEREGARTSQV